MCGTCRPEIKPLRRARLRSGFRCALKAMNQEELARHFENRRRQSERIRFAAEEFKVCSRCASIAYKNSGHCSICGAYRWIESAEAVNIVEPQLPTRRGKVFCNHWLLNSCDSALWSYGGTAPLPLPPSGFTAW